MIKAKSYPNHTPFRFLCIKVDLPPLAILKNVHSFVSQITWWMPHVFCMAEPEAFQDELIGHIKYMGTPPGPSREVRLRRAPPAAQTPAGGARGGMLSMEAGRARCRPRGPRTQPAPAMWRSTCISYGVRIRPMSSSWNASGSAIQIHGAPTM